MTLYLKMRILKLKLIYLPILMALYVKNSRQNTP